MTVFCLIRRLILKGSGFSPTTVVDLESAIGIIVAHDIHLLILCSSLSEVESKMILAEIKKLGKSPFKTLVLTKPESNFRNMAAKVLTSPVAPQTFQSVVGNLLETPSDGD
jgi:hypothetical protein